MAITPSDPEVANAAAQIRRVGQDVYAAFDVSDDERWFGTGPHRARSMPMPAPGTEPGQKVVAAVFPTEEDAWAALLAAQPRIEARLEMGLSSFDGGWPRDQRSVLAIRGGMVTAPKSRRSSPNSEARYCLPTRTSRTDGRTF